MARLKKKQKEWIEVRARGFAARADEAALLILLAGSHGIVETSADPDSSSDFNPDGLGVGTVGTSLSVSPTTDATESSIDPDPESETLITGHLDPSSGSDSGSTQGADKIGDIGTRLSLLRKALKRLGWSLEHSLYKDEDWSLRWRYSLKPIVVTHAGRGIVVRAGWSKRVKKKGETELVIDPSMAFGTGHHATTKLCLKALLRLFTKPKERKKLKDFKVLDIGTGTGVLAIAAMKLGVGSALGIEIDPVSLAIARKTVKANNVCVAVSGIPVEKIGGQYTVIAANILSGELIRLAPVITRRLAVDGTLLLSGILATEADMVIKVYKELGLKALKRFRSGEWVALTFEKPMA
jgi:ribosomal protein L11 methyltransferase